MEYDVTIDRDRYIGGSDIPCIMGISPFKDRFTLLLEKAGYKENEFAGNEYTAYGNALEPKIRGYINQKYNTNFEPNQTTKGDLRANTDGFNGKCILEIKTTSRIHEKLEDYKIYIVQLLFYMQMNEVNKGMLAIYSRPETFNTTFQEERLTIYDIELKDFAGVLDRINEAITRFRTDLAKVKANPFITEEELQPKELIELSNEVVPLENQLKALKAIEQETKKLKAELYKKMTEYDIKKWTTNGGVQITRIDPTPPTTLTEKVFDIEAFKTAHPDLFEQYNIEKTTTKRGRTGYIKITV